MAAMCAALNVLPDKGGLLDQDPTNMKILKMYHDALNERRELEENKRQAQRQSRRPKK